MDSKFKRSIATLIADEYPIAVIARKVGVTRQDIYNFLNPDRYPYRLTAEKLRLIAKFEGRRVGDVRCEYEGRAAA